MLMKDAICGVVEVDGLATPQVAITAAKDKGATQDKAVATDEEQLLPPPRKKVWWKRKWLPSLEGWEEVTIRAEEGPTVP